MSTEAGQNIPEFSVSEISGAIKRTVEGAFQYVRVRGEISGLSTPKSGHIYLSLKDEKSVLRAVCWKGQVSRLAVRPEDGLEVIASGKVTTYAGSSNYQLVIESLEVAGEGALMALLEKRKKEMAAQGLFDEDRKKPIPLFPQKIGVVTSPTGAVIRDILHRLRERFPVEVLLWPVKVQGQGAEHEIAAAIKGFNELDERPDLLIVARGGGSLEDLWCFNEEAVVYAAAESEIPIISAVGHETDTTLIDYVADLRAPTPTGAAEIATEWTIADLRGKLVEYKGRKLQGLQRVMREKEQELKTAVRGIPRIDEVVANFEQKLDQWGERLQNSLPVLVERMAQKLASLKLSPALLTKDVKAFEDKLRDKGKRLDMVYNNKLESSEQRLETATKLFDSLNYKNVLKRGFAMVKDSKGKLVKSVDETKPDMLIEFADGEIKVQKDGML